LAAQLVAEAENGVLAWLVFVFDSPVDLTQFDAFSRARAFMVPTTGHIRIVERAHGLKHTGLRGPDHRSCIAPKTGRRKTARSEDICKYTFFPYCR